MTQRRMPFLEASLPKADGFYEYEPRETLERAETYARHCGIAAGWPIPLTGCRPTGRRLRAVA